MVEPQHIFQRNERMVGRPYLGEFIIVPLVGHGAQLDAIFATNDVGAFVWNQLDGRRDGHAVVQAMTAEFQVDPLQAEKDYQKFVGQLLSVGAVLRVSPEAK